MVHGDGWGGRRSDACGTDSEEVGVRPTTHEGGRNSSGHSSWYVWAYAVDVCTIAAQSLSERPNAITYIRDRMFIFAASLTFSAKRMVAAT